MAEEQGGVLCEAEGGETPTPTGGAVISDTSNLFTNKRIVNQ